MTPCTTMPPTISASRHSGRSGASCRSTSQGSRPFYTSQVGGCGDIYRAGSCGCPCCRCAQCDLLQASGFDLPYPGGVASPGAEDCTLFVAMNPGAGLPCCHSSCLPSRPCAYGTKTASACHTISHQPTSMCCLVLLQTSSG